MDSNVQLGFTENIQELFSSGTVILFTCAANEQFPLLSVSENAEDILGFAPSYFLDQEHGWSSQIHPDDKQGVKEGFREVLNEGREVINEYRFKTKAGSYIWLRDEIKLIKNSDSEPLIYGSSINITGRKKAEIALKESKTEELKEEIARREQAEKKLHKRLAYEKAISQCAELLLSNTSSEALRQSLQILQRATEADRIFLYNNHEQKGELYLEPEMEVTGKGIAPIVQNLDREFKYADIPWLYKKLSNLEKVQASIDDLPEPERSILKDQNVESMLIIPIVVDGAWAGYIGFADTHNKRKWEEEEVSLLETTARIIAAFKKRKTIQSSLLQQRNYTETVLDSLPSIYILMDQDLQLVRWNSNAEKNTGYSTEELKQMEAADLIVQDEHEKLQKAIDEVRNEKAEGTELQLQTKSGEIVPYFWHGYFIKLEGQKYFLCVGMDITQQKRTEKELLDEKRFTEALLKSLPGIFYMFDTDGNYERWNQNLLDETGYTAEDMKEISPDAFFDSEDYNFVEEEIQKVFTDGKSDIESNLLTKNGQKIPYFFTGKSFERDGEEYLVGVGHDISAQVKAREKLRRSEELFHNLFLKAPAAIVMVDPENKVQDINKSFERLFGFAKDDIEGRDIDDVIVPKEDRERVPRMPIENFSSDSFHREAQRITKEGELIDVFVAAIPVYVDGEPIAGFGMYIDITEQKKYEQEIYTSLEEKKVLLQEIHHRVKNNLAVVSGLLQLQMYETEDPVIRETLRESENRIQTMALIHEKLYNSQNLSRISCDSYIGDLVETIRNTIQTEKDITVNTDIAEVKLTINKAVPFALLVNEFVTNSFKHAFTDERKGTIDINLDKEDGQLHVYICDNGRGLPEDLSPEETDSLGLNLINNFAEQLDAEWDMGTDNGTYIELIFDAGDVNGSSSNILDN